MTFIICSIESEKKKRDKNPHANEFFLLSALTNKILITVYKSNVNQVDAESYKKFTESLNLYSLICGTTSRKRTHKIDKF